MIFFFFCTKITCRLIILVPSTYTCLWLYTQMLLPVGGEKKIWLLLIWLLPSSQEWTEIPKLLTQDRINFFVEQAVLIVRPHLLVVFQAFTVLSLHVVSMLFTLDPVKHGADGGTQFVKSCPNWLLYFVVMNCVFKFLLEPWSAQNWNKSHHTSSLVHYPFRHLAAMLWMEHFYMTMWHKPLGSRKYSQL